MRIRGSWWFGVARCTVVLGVVGAQTGCGGDAGGPAQVSSEDSGSSEGSETPDTSGSTGNDEAGTVEGGSSTSEGGDCGNGVVDDGEACDDGEESAACNADCTVPACGDGVRNQVAGEGCDDGNVAGGDACSATCEPAILALDGPLSEWLDPDDIPIVATGDVFAMAWAHGEDASFYDQLRYGIIDGDGTPAAPIALTNVPGYVLQLGVDETGAGLLAFQHEGTIEYRFVAPGGALDLDGGFSEALTNESWFVPAAPPAALGDGRFCVLGHTGGLRCTVGEDGLGPPVEIAAPQAMPTISSIDYARLTPRAGGLVASYIAYVDGMISRDLRVRAIGADGQADGTEVTLLGLGQNGPERPGGGWFDASGSFRVGFGLESSLDWYAIGASGPVVAGASGSLENGENARVLVATSGDLLVLWRTRVTEELGPQHVIHTCALWVQPFSPDLAQTAEPLAITEPANSHCVTTYGAALGPDGDLMVVWHRVLTDAYPPIAFLEGMLLPAPL